MVERISESELVRDVRAVLARAETGREIIIERDDHRPIAVISAPRRSGRPIVEVLAEARSRKSSGILDCEFGKDMEEIIAGHSQPWNPPSWE